jgi:hypothetical protein
MFNQTTFVSIDSILANNRALYKIHAVLNLASEDGFSLEDKNCYNYNSLRCHL